MTKLLERALDTARRLSSSEQDEIARAILALAGSNSELVALSDSERAAIAQSKAAAANSEFATEAEVKAVWARHGL